MTDPPQFLAKDWPMRMVHHQKASLGDAPRAWPKIERDTKFSGCSLTSEFKGQNSTIVTKRKIHKIVPRIRK